MCSERQTNYDWLWGNWESAHLARFGKYMYMRAKLASPCNSSESILPVFTFARKLGRITCSRIAGHLRICAKRNSFRDRRGADSSHCFGVPFPRGLREAWTSFRWCISNTVIAQVLSLAKGVNLKASILSNAVTAKPIIRLGIVGRRHARLGDASSVTRNCLSSEADSTSVP